MSGDIEGKLAPRRFTAGLARASLEALRKFRGYVVIDGPPSKPTRVETQSMGGRNEWRLVPGADLYEVVGRYQ